jgi:Flp pilus assembly protein TadG
LALIISVTFGVVGLAIDASRAMVVRSESQAAADAAALAAASQLDGTPTAITRANTALANLVSNRHRMASEAAGPVGIAQVRYLSGLPSSDASPITAGFVTTNPLQARFVEITTTPLTQTAASSRR